MEFSLSSKSLVSLNKINTFILKKIIHLHINVIIQLSSTRHLNKVAHSQNVRLYQEKKQEQLE